MGQLSYIVCFCVGFLTAPFIYAQSPTKQLVLGTWPDYISPEVIAAFEKEYNASVIQNYFNSEDDRDEQIVRFGANHFDLALVSGYMMPFYIKMNWIDPIDPKSVPNSQLISRAALDFYRDALHYGIPYFGGVTGIAYREDLVDGIPDSWMDILSPADKHRGRVRMLDDSVDLVTICLKILGIDSENITRDNLKKIKQLLQGQKPFVSSYEYVDLTAQSSLVTGEDHMAFIYSGDAVVLNSINPKIKFSLPEEGSSSWLDFWVVMNGTKNEALAKQFLNFINRPKWAAINAEFVSYLTLNQKALELTSETYRNNQIIFYDEQKYDKIKPYGRLSPSVKREINSITAGIIY